MVAAQDRKPHRARALLGTCLLLAAGGAGAQLAGEIEFARGVGFAQTAGQTPRTLGKGLTLKEGDRLTTSEGASAIIKLEDGTRMTVRPNSELVLQQYRFKENAADNGMLMQLVRGGVTHFGLGQRQRVEICRSVWTNGVPQDIIRPDPNKLLYEDQKPKGSCPNLYTWDGEKFVMVTDCLWSSALRSARRATTSPSCRGRTSWWLRRAQAGVPCRRCPHRRSRRIPIV